MFGGLAEQLKRQAARKVRGVMVKLALATASTVLLFLAFGFLVAAAARALASLYGDLAADLMLGGAFLILSLILFFIAGRPSGAPEQPPAAAANAGAAPTSTPLSATIAAFAYGFARGLGSKRRPKAGPPSRQPAKPPAD